MRVVMLLTDFPAWKLDVDYTLALATSWLRGKE
jgi:hypothetical protein